MPILAVLWYLYWDLLMVYFQITMSEDNCTVDANGTLKNANDIEWSYDPDPSVQPPSASSSSLNAFDMLSASGKTPATIVSGRRISTRFRRPAAKVQDQEENNSAKGKRKAPTSPQQSTRRTARKSSNGARMVANSDSEDSSDADGIVSTASAVADTEIETDGDDGARDTEADDLTLDELKEIDALDKVCYFCF